MKVVLPWALGMVCIGTMVGACSASEDGAMPSDSAATATDGGTAGDGNSATPECLDASGRPTDTCAVEPDGQRCEEASNPACAVLSMVQVSNPAADGPCLRVVMDNACDEVVYSRTCIEFHEPDDDEPQWQCWTSTTYPGFDVDVGECHATGAWRQWSSFSSGELDVLEGTCEPEA